MEIHEFNADQTLVSNTDTLGTTGEMGAQMEC